MKQLVMKVGNSLAVTIPSDFVKNLGIKQGSLVEVRRRSDKGEISYKFSGVQQLSLSPNYFPKKRGKNK